VSARASCGLAPIAMDPSVAWSGDDNNMGSQIRGSGDRAYRWWCPRTVRPEAAMANRPEVIGSQLRSSGDSGVGEDVGDDI
jgi:hypothetical protein